MLEGISELIEPSLVWYIVFATLVYSLVIGLATLMFQILLYYQQEKLSFKMGFTVVSLSQFVNFLTPLKIGPVIGKPIIGKITANLPLRKTISATAFENFLGILIQLLMFPILIFYVGDQLLLDGGLLLSNALIKWLIIFTVILLGAYISYSYNWFIPQLIKLKFLVPVRLKKFVKRFGFTEEAVEKILNDLPSFFLNKKLVLKLVLIIGIQACILPLTFLLALHYFNVQIPYMLLFSMYWIAYIIGRLSIFPGGLGVKDVTLGGMLLGAGVSGVSAIKIVLVYRLFNLFPILLLGGIPFLMYGRNVFKYRRIKPPVS
ncbi:MAG: lysylphosphatidylglycerol synthase transmembrane domain-containing protein [Nanoarchaeota archaeon]|mgnify:CR=1 FL=1